MDLLWLGNEVILSTKSRKAIKIDTTTSPRVAWDRQKDCPSKKTKRAEGNRFQRELYLSSMSTHDQIWCILGKIVWDFVRFGYKVLFVGTPKSILGLQVLSLVPLSEAYDNHYCPFRNREPSALLVLRIKPIFWYPLFERRLSYGVEWSRNLVSISPK